MSKDFNWKPYYITVAAIVVITCIFSWKIAFGIGLGSFAFYLNDLLNQKRFPPLDSKKKAIFSTLLIVSIQILMIIVVALISYYVGKLYAFFGAFAGLTIPYFYFIIKMLIKR